MFLINLLCACTFLKAMDFMVFIDVNNYGINLLIFNDVQNIADITS